MTDIVLPPGLKIARNRFRYIGNTGVTRGAYNGVAQTTGLGGDRVGSTLEFTMHGGKSTAGRAERALLMAFMMRMRGRQNRILLTDVAHSAPRGSFPATELFANVDFSSGTTGWTTGGDVSTADGVLRSGATGSGSVSFVGQTPTGVQYAPYALRSVIADGYQSSGQNIGPYLDGGGNVSNVRNSSRGYKVASVVTLSATLSEAWASFWLSTSYTPGAYATLPFTSLARCFLTDSGGTLPTKSDELDHSDWTKSELTVTANATTAPSGATTADKLIPSTNNTAHFESQNNSITSSAQDILICGYFKAAGYDYVRLVIREGTGSTSAEQIFNLNTGAVGATGASGANWSNRRSAIASMGDGWYYCAMIARKTNAATTLTSFLSVHNADNTSAFAGNGTNGIYGFRANAFPSSSFAAPVQSTTASVAATTQTGSVLNVKGLPASTSGLLLAGDWVEIDGQLKMVTDSLNSNAAGLGVLEFSPPLYRAVDNNTPVIVYKPMGRFILASEIPEWSNEPGVISTASLELEEAYA